MMVGGVSVGIFKLSAACIGIAIVFNCPIFIVLLLNQDELTIVLRKFWNINKYFLKDLYAFWLKLWYKHLSFIHMMPVVG